LSKRDGRTFDIKGFAEAFGEAFDVRGFGAAFRRAFDIRDAHRSFGAGVRHGVDLLAKIINPEQHPAAARQHAPGRSPVGSVRERLKGVRSAPERMRRWLLPHPPMPDVEDERPGRLGRQRHTHDAE
jgi:hypothetical protein